MLLRQPIPLGKRGLALIRGAVEFRGQRGPRSCNCVPLARQPPDLVPRAGKIFLVFC